MRKLEDNRNQGKKVPNTRTLKSFSESNARFPEKKEIVVDSQGKWLLESTKIYRCSVVVFAKKNQT